MLTLQTVHSYTITRIKEYEYYTVLFSVSRVMGYSAQLILSRAMNAAIIRPKSVTTGWIKSRLKLFVYIFKFKPFAL